MMKKILLTVVALWISTFVFAQGVNFQNITFKEALEKAKQENKFVFMDCYTSWCGPCKRMMNEVFPQEQVGKFFNEKFISVKYDMEKGEGLALRNRYGVGVYPTFLILDSQGKIRYKFMGYCSSEDLLKHAEKGISSVSAYAEMEACYQAGERSKEFLEKYLNQMKAFNDSRMPQIASELANTLTEEEKVSQKYWYLYSARGMAPRNSANFKYLLEHCDKFHQSLGEKINVVVYNAYMPVLSSITGVLRSRDTTSLETLNQIEKELKLWPEYIDKSGILLHLAICKAFKNNDMDELIQVSDKGFSSCSEEVSVGYLRICFSLLSEKGTVKQKETLCDVCERYGNGVKQEVNKQSIDFNIERLRKEILAHRAVEKNSLNKFMKECDKQFIGCGEPEIISNIEAFSTAIGQKGTETQKELWLQFCGKYADKVKGEASKKAMKNCMIWLERMQQKK